MVNPPRWLSNQAIDQLDEEAYEPLRLEFMAVLEKTEQELQVSTAPHQRLSAVMKQASETGSFCYKLALRSPMGLVRVFYDHIQPILTDRHEDNDEFYTVMMDNWTVKTVPFINKKLADKEDYNRRLRQAFEGEAGESVETPSKIKVLFKDDTVGSYILYTSIQE